MDGEVKARLEGHDIELRDLKDRVAKVEGITETLHQMNTSLEVMANELKHMRDDDKNNAAELKQINGRLDAIERKPLETLDDAKKAAVSKVASAVATVVILLLIFAAYTFSSKI